MAPLLEKDRMFMLEACWLLTIAAHFLVSKCHTLTTPPSPFWAEASSEVEAAVGNNIDKFKDEENHPYPVGFERFKKNALQSK